MDIDLSNVAAVLFVISPLVLLLIRLFVVPDGMSLDDVIPPMEELREVWRGGLQEEEEPARWRIERLTVPRQTAALPDGASVAVEDADPNGAGLASRTAA